ncbi:MAG: response regulator [Aggregatilineales bacterium]
MTTKHDPPLVLIADDQVPTTILLERVFEHEGYQIKSVYDGITAVQTAKNLLPDLILLDVNMPGMNGFDVLRELRENPITTNIPTILITAMGDLSNVVHGLKLGADDYLRKPFQAQELLARAQSKMRSRKLEESLHRRSQELEALLRVAEELNQHLEIEDLIEFIFYLGIDLLSGHAAALFQFDEQDNRVTDMCIRTRDNADNDIPLDKDAILKYLRNHPQAQLWSEDAPLFATSTGGMIAPLQHRGTITGMLMIIGETPYDENHLRLLNGIGRQAALALRNAELYELQLNYSQHLEDKVAARTAELESAQQMLIRSEKLASVGRLAASIAHEINNPLFPIQINLEHMLEDIQSGGQIDEEEIKRTQESVERIRRIVNQLLEFAGKRRTGDHSVEPLDINKIIQSIISLNRKFFEQENIKTDFSPKELPLIEGNRDQLEQVLMNMTLNAKAAMKSGGVLEITTLNHDNDIMIKIKDTGHGIPKDMLETIFEPFVSTKEEGTGLGLFISHGIIQNHNGSIRVESHEGVGTTFTITLPASVTVVEQKG